MKNLILFCALASAFGCGTEGGGSSGTGGSSGGATAGTTGSSGAGGSSGGATAGTTGSSGAGGSGVSGRGGDGGAGGAGGSGVSGRGGGGGAGGASGSGASGRGGGGGSGGTGATFPCPQQSPSRQCQHGSQYCRVTSMGMTTCEPLPAACGNSPSCACIPLLFPQCDSCKQSAAGDLESFLAADCANLAPR